MDFDCSGLYVCISTHAPAGGATRLRFSDIIIAHTISTHAPAGGATKIRFCRCCMNWIFLLTPLREGRPSASVISSCGRIFLLTPLREGRLKPFGAARFGIYFYSRPCGRGDGAHPGTRRFRAFISTHAPAGGATGRSRRRQRAGQDFYSRPCGRGDAAAMIAMTAHSAFLLTPLREGRPSP